MLPAPAMTQIPPVNCKLGAAMRTRDSEFASGHGGESGELHCKLGHAVQIEPGLRQQSPKNGSFSNVRRRLSAISLRECPKSEPGDWRPIRKSPPLAGLSASIRDSFSERRTAWLATQCRSRRSPANSLLTGNLTGKITISDLKPAVLEPETAVSQGLFSKFPKQPIREFLSWNREF
jgi:hypothetical protein